MIKKSIYIASAVREALATGRPVVALESTIVTHGMPYPQNVECALEVESEIRREGCLPATIAVVKGELHVGLSADELSVLANTENVLKLSSRDLPYALATGRSGGTTVAATLRIAELAGIQVFATGGIGGVHRGATESFDVSADLLALSRARVAVVCAGPKAILDLALTLEQLETFNVAVLGYQTQQLPAFYYRDSGLPVTCMEDIQEVAAFVAQNRSLGLCGGPLLCVPVPEAAALGKEEVESAIERALQGAEAISGKALTPYLLDAVMRETGGRSLDCNRALIKNNARVAAQLATALHLL